MLGFIPQPNLRICLSFERDFFTLADGVISYIILINLPILLNKLTTHGQKSINWNQFNSLRTPF